MQLPARLILAPMLGALAVGLGACGSPGAPPAAPPTSPAPSAAVHTPSPLTGTPWTTATSYRCPSPDQKVELAQAVYGDVTGDRVADAVVSLTCSTSTSSNPIQIEAFDGASDPARPRSIGVLIEAQDPMYVEKAEITIARPDITVVGHAVGTDAALAAGPQVRFGQTFTYRDGTLRPGPRH